MRAFSERDTGHYSSKAFGVGLCFNPEAQVTKPYLYTFNNCF